MNPLRHASLGKLLQQFREEKLPGVSLRRVARDLGFDYTYLHRLENGLHRPTDDKLARIAEVYKLTQSQIAELVAYAQAYTATIEVMRNINPQNFTTALSGAFFRTEKKSKK